MTDGTMAIGAFARRSGLSITALRYYDEVGLLRPAAVDATSGYRRYDADQLERAARIRVLRTLDLPMVDLRSGATSADGLLAALSGERDRLVRRARTLGELAVAVAQDRRDAVEEYLEREREKGTEMSDSTARPVQITLRADEREATIRFYGDVFDATFDASISSFVFGTWKTDSFFLLTLESEVDGARPAPAACFGMLVTDVDAAHARALAAGASEVDPPADFEWKPRTSIVDDPSGNRIALSQD